MRNFIKTTIDLPSGLFLSAKKRAAELHKPLRELVESGLRSQLAASGAKRRRHGRIRWVTVDGGLPVGLNVADRAAMHEWLCRPPR